MNKINIMYKYITDNFFVVCQRLGKNMQTRQGTGDEITLQYGRYMLRKDSHNITHLSLRRTKTTTHEHINI